MSRSNRPEPASRFAVLRHPLFLGALALLLVNDHALKGAGVLPGVLTGKLSDLAGLLVAPVFVASLLGARTPRSRALAFAAVALPFAAIKLSATAAGALAALLTLLGIPSHIWQDPTDLIALLMLLPAWRLSSSAPPSTGSPGLPRWAFERAVLAVTAVACVATSAAPPEPGTYSTTAYLVNVAPHTVDVRVRWVDAELDCGALLAGDPTRMLGANAFNLGITYRLEPYATLPLERAAAYVAAGQGADGEGGAAGVEPQACEVALIETDRMPAMMVWWAGLSNIGVTPDINEMPDFWTREDLVAGRVTLMPPGLGTPGKVEKGPLRLNIPPSGCGSAGQSSIQWTSPVQSLPSIGILEEVQEVPGGCLELTMTYPQLAGTGGSDQGGGGAGGSGGADTGGAGGAAGGSGGEEVVPGQVLYLCIPLEDFPFANGDELQLLEVDANLSVKDFVSTRRLELYRNFESVSLGGLDAQAVSGDCEGDRLLCGAYSMPATLSVQTGGKASLLKPGEVLSGAGFHVRLGRAERVVVARDECGPGLDAPGISADFLISWQ